MRKSRLVILPTRRLDRIGFLLLFLSCPVIGDWGRIQPDTEASDKAIQIDKEGTCGLQRDTSPKLPNFNQDGSLQSRPSDVLGYEPTETFLSQRTQRTSTNQKLVRDAIERRLVERRDVRRTDREVTERNVRSRSVEPRRLSRSQSDERRNEANAPSLSRLEARTRRDSRLLLARQTRDARNEPRDGNNRRSLRRESESRRREDTRRQVTESNQRRLSLARIERDANRRSEDAERRTARARSADRRNMETRRENEIRRSVRDERRDVRRIKRTSDVRMERFDEIRLSRTSLKPKSFEPDQENGDAEFLSGVLEWIGLKNYETPKIGDWTTNCVIGAVTYFLTSKQVKSA